MSVAGASGGSPCELLVDPRFGVIRALTPQPRAADLPAALVAVTATVSDTARFGPWQGDRISMGASFYDPVQARAAAIGEAVERYCGNFVPADLRRASFAELAEAGEVALDPAELVLYSPAQYREPGFPFVPLTRDLRVLWTTGRDLVDGASLWVPASLVYINYFVGALEAEPPTHFVMYSGIAAGPDRAWAERSALEELIERDATMIWWQSGSPATGIEWRGDRVIEAALATPGDDSALRYDLIRIPTVFDVPVIGALLRDERQGIAGLGVACRPDPRAAALKAIIEAIALRGYAEGLLDPEGNIWRAVAAGFLDGSVFKPYRADRRYLDDFRPDWHDVTDLGTQSQVYLDPRMAVHLDRIRHPADRLSFDEIAPMVGEDPRRGYLDRLTARGLRPISVDVTTADVHAAGLTVVRVIVPGLSPNAPAAFPFLGGRRLYEDPAELGGASRVLTEDDLIRVPLPHT